VVAEETVWSLAKQGLLCSEEQWAVIEAAREWVQSWDRADGPPDEMDAEEDIKLYAAVQALGAAIDPVELDEAFAKPVLTPAQ
jgi:hypothetical protein